MSFDFDDTYEERLAAALASGMISIVPHRLDEWKGKKEMELEVTLNGVKMKGTADQLAEIARKLGVTLGDDGTWYMSNSRGLVRIADMDDAWLRNAIAKRVREWAQSLNALEGAAFVRAVTTGTNDITTLAMVRELTARVARKTYR